MQVKSRPGSSQVSSAATSDVEEESSAELQHTLGMTRKRPPGRNSHDSKRAKESDPTSKGLLYDDESGFEDCIKFVFERFKVKEGKPDEAMRCLYFKVCDCIAGILCDRLAHIQEAVKFCEQDLMPYKGVSEADLTAIANCRTVFSVMNTLGILAKWLNTSSLDFFIFTSTEPRSREQRRASYWLDQYNCVLGDFCCQFLMNELPGKFYEQLNKREFVHMKHHSTLCVAYKHDFAKFTLDDLRKETAFLEQLLGLPPEVIRYLQSEEGNSTTVYWAFDMSYVMHIFSLSDVRRLFWKLLEHCVLSLELKGVMSISLRGRHVLYLIKNALQTGQNLIKQTEVCVHGRHACACMLCVHAVTTYICKPLIMYSTCALYTCFNIHRYSLVSFMLWLDWE